MTITTPYGNRYEVNKKGQISKDGVTPSDGWLLLGIEHVKRSEFIPFKSLTPERIQKLELLWRTSNNPQYTVRDLDHGTTRVWGNTKYHGIRTLTA